MNERIKELAEQAGSETWSRAPMRAVTGLAFTDENLEKFADSIVWECMKICEDVMKKDNSALGCWSEIKRKFRS